MTNKAEMWKLAQTAKATGTRPSKLLQIDDPWIALQLDNAATLVGSVIEGAAQEQEKVGSGDNAKWQAKYTMDQLLDPRFRLPPPKTREDVEHDNARAFMGLPGIKVVKPKEG